MHRLVFRAMLVEDFTLFQHRASLTCRIFDFVPLRDLFYVRATGSVVWRHVHAHLSGSLLSDRDKAHAPFFSGGSTAAGHRRTSLCDCVFDTDMPELLLSFCCEALCDPCNLGAVSRGFDRFFREAPKAFWEKLLHQFLQHDHDCSRVRL